MPGQPCKAFALDVCKASLPYGIRASLDDVGTTIGGDALYLDAETLYVPQMFCHLVLPFIISQPEEQRGLDRLVAVEHKAQLVREPCAVNQQVDLLMELDPPNGTAVKVLVEPSRQLPRAVSA